MRTSLICVATTALLLATAARADAVSDWFEFAGAAYDAGHTADAPFDAGVYLSGTRTSLAMFEAANSVDRRYVSFLHVAPARRGAARRGRSPSRPRHMMSCLRLCQRRRQ